jgi:DNA-binding transcriptional MerR regulator
MEPALTTDPQVPTYRSGAAASLAGIPVATLRMWERRYGVVGPGTSQRGHRRYTADDVRRLALIKTLVDEGHSIGALARLTFDALRAKRAEAPSRASLRPGPAAGELRVALVGEALAARAGGAADRFPSLRVVGAFADPADAAAGLAGMTVDVLAMELPALRDDAVASVEQLVAATGAPRALVAYRFATESAVEALRRRGHVVVHAPIGLAEIASLGGGHVAAAAAVAPGAGPPPPPRFGERALAQLAQVATAVRCECPRNVVDLLLSLGAFERYSAECENRSPADAELHRHLGSVAGHARALLEDALVRVAQAEGIALPPAAAPVAK